jgi:predicted nuclease of predicted toxin-antitoxin system
MKILVDMNLPPALCPILEAQGWATVHWSTIGDPRAPDSELMRWSLQNDHVLLTHDLDFGAILTATAAQGPSVIQVRTQNVMPRYLEPILVPVLKQFSAQLDQGSLIIVDEGRARVRILPIRR